MSSLTYSIMYIDKIGTSPPLDSIDHSFPLIFDSISYEKCKAGVIEKFRENYHILNIEPAELEDNYNFSFLVDSFDHEDNWRLLFIFENLTEDYLRILAKHPKIRFIGVMNPSHMGMAKCYSIFKSAVIYNPKTDEFDQVRR